MKTFSLNPLWAIALLAVGLASAPQNHALIIAGPDIIPPPASVINNPPGAVNDHQQGFNERQNVLLLAPLNVDGGGVIPAGTTVDSHMIFLNTDGTVLAQDTQTWTFSGIVLGTMSDGTGSLEVASSPLLGALGTIYPAAPFTARGLESNDDLMAAGNQITLRSSVTEPGDWIRVITESTATVPEGGASFLLLCLGVGGMAMARRLKSLRA